METSLPASATEKGIVFRAADEAGHALFSVPADIVLPDALEIRIENRCSHLDIRIGMRSSVSLCLLFEDDAPKTDHTTEIILDDESSLRLLGIQDCPASSRVSIRQRATVGNGAALTVQNVSLGGGDVAHDLVSTVAGRDASSSVDWMFYGKGNERQTLSARNVFDGVNGGGEILMKGVAQDKAHVAANGLIDIGLHGGGTNTYLTQNVLMLDASAKVDAIPGLEIKTNDVKASHSATVSRVTAEDLFYFAARGIPAAEARRMYVLGFLGDITGRIPDMRLREKVLASIEKKYGA